MMKAETNPVRTKPTKNSPRFPFVEYPVLVFGAIAVLQFALLFPILDQGPLGQHAWRQAVGHAMARNYVDEPSAFLLPRNDIRPLEANSGYIYHEFPLQYFGAAKLSKVFGLSTDFSIRLLQFLIVSWAGLVGYAFATGLGHTTRRSILFGFFMTSAPVCFYYMGSVAPNFVGLVCFLAGTALLLHWTKLFKGHDSGNQTAIKFWAGIALILLGTLVKPLYLLFGLSLAYIFVIGARKIQKRKLPEISMKKWLSFFLIGGGCVVLVNTAILHHAQQLYIQAPFLQQIHTPMGPAEVPESWAILWKNLEVGFGTWFLEMYVGHAALLLFGLGAYAAFVDLKKKSLKENLANESLIFWVCWCVSFLAYSCFFISRFADHDYYLCSLLPVAALFSSRGADFLIERGSRQIGLAWQKYLVFGLCAAQLAIMYLRVYKRWYVNPQVPIELRTRGEDLLQGIAPKERVVVVGDSTPIVFLYYLHRKGFAIGPQENAQTPLQEALKNGIRIAVVYKGTALAQVQQYYPQHIKALGDFQIFAADHFKP